MNTARIRHLLRRKPLFVARTLVLVILLTLRISASAMAESAADLLERAIYAEETVGDLATAIQIYSQIAEDAEANRPHVAQAQLRLGLCLLKQDKVVAGRAALDTVIRDFSDHPSVVAQARDYLASAQLEQTLMPAPWEDGERLHYQIRLPTGRVMGAVYHHMTSAVVDGVAAWRLEVRKMVMNQADNYGVSQVWADRATFQPLRSTFRHGILGNADATYGTDGVAITSGERSTRVDDVSLILDHEQLLFLVRRLPLAPGNTKNLRVLPTWMGDILDVTLTVRASEPCRVPAGDFDCLPIDVVTGANQETLWLSDDSDRRVVRLETGGATIELVDRDHVDPEAPVPFGLADFGFTGSLPPGWQPYEFRPPGRRHGAMVRFLGPDADSISAIESDHCPPGRCPSLAETAQGELKRAEQRFEGFTLRDGSWTERTIAGHPAISFISDYERNGASWVQYRLYTFTDDEVRLEILFRSPSDRFEAVRPTFDGIVDRLETRDRVRP